MRTDEAKKTMIAAIMHERERLPRESADGNKNHERADTLVGVIRGTISEDQVIDMENDDVLSETDAETCRNAFLWLNGNDEVKLVEDEDLESVAPKALAEGDRVLVKDGTGLPPGEYEAGRPIGAIHDDANG